MQIDYILLPKLKPEICRADLTADQVFVCCMPRPAVPVDQMHNMQHESDNDRLHPVRRKLPMPIHIWAGLYDQKRADFGDFLRRQKFRSASSRVWNTKDTLSHSYPTWRGILRHRRCQRVTVKNLK